MKAVIIEFSPSGNTNKVGELLKSKLEKNDITVQVINIARNKEYFFADNKHSFLKNVVKEHDILFIGAPVYAHHLQYHVKELIENLPEPQRGWGKIAIPFVTYGGVSSGIALDEAGKLLRKTGRKVLAGMKVSSSHHMTKVFIGEEYNKDQPEDVLISTIDELIKRINASNLNCLKDNSKFLKYQCLGTYIKANLIFKEKVWHEKRYPKIVVDSNKCIKCGKCTRVCPVFHVKQDKDKSIVNNSDSDCIHCLNCIFECPQKAIHPVGNLEKAKNFMEKNLMKNKAEAPETCLYPRA